MNLWKLIDIVCRFSRFGASQKMSYYAVANGRKTGVYDSWGQCEEQVRGFPGAKFKKFSTLAEAQQFAGTTIHKPIGACSFSTNNKKFSSDDDYSKQADALPSQLHHASTTSQGKHQQFYYAVAKGKKVGVYSSWQDCKQQIDGFSYPKYKKFTTMEEATDFIQSSGSSAKKTEKSYSICDNYSSFGKLSIAKFNNFEFQRDDSGYVHCFTDGSCESNGRATARAGIGVWFSSNHPLNISEPVDGPPTNNVAEIQAATKAINTAKSCGIDKLQVNTDSQFLIKCITEWMPKWKKNGWKLSTGGDVKNKDQLVELSAAIDKGVNVKWNYVQAHVGIDGNEHADKLAKAGAANYKATMTRTGTSRFKPY